MKINYDLDNLLLLINNKLDHYLQPKEPHIIYEAMNYSVQAGGKRFRPIIMLSICEALGGNINNALDFACAIELIHTYSLIHDDLPSMDNDDFRRGKLTCHKKFGEGIAILAGDSLLNLAFEVMIQKVKDSFEYKYLHVMDIIATSAGVKGMIGGQIADIISENKKIDECQLMFIHKNKTAKLISSAIISGAIIAEASEEIINSLKVAGESLGLAFQIQDDILDVTSNTETLGKPVLSDVKNKKTTYVTLKGLKQAEKDYLNYSKSSLEILKSLGLEEKFFYKYIKMMIDRKK